MNLDLRYMFGAPGAWRNWLHQFRGKNYTLQDLDQLKKVKKIRFFLAEGGGGGGGMVVAKGRFKMVYHTFHYFTEGFHEFDIFLKFLFLTCQICAKPDCYKI